jgi:hypothetical protein
MTKINIAKIFFLTLVTLLTGCGESTAILKDRDFSSGDWLLVNSDGNKKTQFIIDDEKVLQENPYGIKVRFSEEDHYTTCDGQLKLFKDGKLVAEQLYLDPFSLTENSAIKEAYKKSSGDEVYPDDANDFKKQWDSLKKIPKCYPTIYHTQPDDKDIIWFYKYE